MTDNKQCHAIAEDPQSAGNVDKVFRRLLQLVSPAQNAISVRDVTVTSGFRTFSINLKMYFRVLWNVSSSTA